jgi:hypothetical protein
LRDQSAADLLDRREFVLGLVPPAAPPALLAAGLAGKPRQLVERPARAAEAAQQLGEGLRADAATRSSRRGTARAP